MRASATAVLGCLALINLPAGASHACTSFCMDTPGGPVYGTNMDLFLGQGLVFVNRRGIAKMGYSENTNGETAAWVSEYGSVTFNLVGRELAWGGMNEAGLVVGTMDRGVLPQFNPGESVERVAAAAQKIESFGADPGVSAVDYSLGVLTETVVAPKKWWSNWFDEPYTRWSIVFDISRREICFRTVTRPSVRRLSLRAFDFSCEAPVTDAGRQCRSRGKRRAGFHALRSRHQPEGVPRVLRSMGCRRFEGSRRRTDAALRELRLPRNRAP